RGAARLGRARSGAARPAHRRTVPRRVACRMTNAERWRLPLRSLVAAFSGRSPTDAAIVLAVLALPQLYVLPRGTIDIALSTVAAVALLPGLGFAARRGELSGLATAGYVRVLLGLLAVRIL